MVSLLDNILLVFPEKKLVISHGLMPYEAKWLSGRPPKMHAQMSNGI